jgi:hypothetical protein
VQPSTFWPELKESRKPADKKSVELVIVWALAAATAVVVGAWGVRNRRNGYQRPPRRALLEEGFRLLLPIEGSETPPETVSASIAKETPIEQLVNLNLAVQSAAPVQVEERAEDPEVIHSPT